MWSDIAGLLTVLNLAPLALLVNWVSGGLSWSDSEG